MPSRSRRRVDEARPPTPPLGSITTYLCSALSAARKISAAPPRTKNGDGAMTPPLACACGCAQRGYPLGQGPPSPSPEATQYYCSTCATPADGLGPTATLSCAHA